MRRMLLSLAFILTLSLTRRLSTLRLFAAGWFLVGFFVWSLVAVCLLRTLAPGLVVSLLGAWDRPLQTFLARSQPARAANTHSTPDEARERGAWFGDGFTPYIQSGCLPAVPAASLTFTAFACVGYVKGASADLVYVTQAAVTLTLANSNGTHWLALHRDTSSAVSGWTRLAGSHYLFQQAGSQPANPSGGLVTTKVTVAAGIITVVAPLSGRNGPVPLSVVHGAYSAKEFGMVGDGSDVTQAFTQAIAALPATGGKIVFPHGTYKISSAISLKDLRNITLECVSTARRVADSQSCTLDYTAASGSLFTFEGAVGIVIRGFNLAYSHAAYADKFIDLTQGTGLQNTSEILFEFNRIGGLSTSSKTATMLIHAAETVYDITLQYNQFLNAAIGIQGSTVSTINSNIVTIRHNLFTTTFTDAHIRAGGSQWNIEDNTFEPRSGAVGNALFIETIGLTGLRYTGNWHGDGNSASTIWLQATGGVLSGALIAGNMFSDPHASSTCLSLGAATGIMITGNYFNCNVAIVAGSAVNTAILGNFFGGGITQISGYPSGYSLVQQIGSTNTALQIGAAGGAQSAALLGLRNAGSGNALEWGLFNQSGYGSTLGQTTGTGQPFVCFHCEHGTNANTYRTRGIPGFVLESDNSSPPNLVLGHLPTATADNQTKTNRFVFSTSGQLQIVGQTVANLGTPADSTITIATDGQVTGAADNTCAAGGTGALAIRLAGVWRCFALQN